MNRDITNDSMRYLQWRMSQPFRFNKYNVLLIAYTKFWNTMIDI